jgi:hypothetical protein
VAAGAVVVGGGRPPGAGGLDGTAGDGLDGTPGEKLAGREGGGVATGVSTGGAVSPGLAVLPGTTVVVKLAHSHSRGVTPDWWIAAALSRPT